jgi:hypothetical protein
MPRSEAASPTLGWVLALVGLGWLGTNYGIDPSRVLGPLWPWPLFLFLVGVAVLLGRGRGSGGRGIALIAAGLVVWGCREHLVPLLPYARTVEPALLIVIGGAIIWRALDQREAG